MINWVKKAPLSPFINYFFFLLYLIFKAKHPKDLKKKILKKCLFH